MFTDKKKKLHVKILWVLFVIVSGVFVLTFKFNISQVLRKVMKSYFKPLIELFGKLSNNLSQTVRVEKTTTTM